MARNILQDFPLSPLDRYRKKGSFDWKAMKILLETEEIILFVESIVCCLKQELIFNCNNAENIDEERKLSNKRMFSLLDLYLDSNWDDRKVITVSKIFAWRYTDTGIKYTHCVEDGMTLNAIKILGTKNHLKYVDLSKKRKTVGCFCLTEIGHGTNTKAMRTTATYDPKTQEFVIHTADFEAAKCWAANLGQTATFALVYAQLYTPDGQNHGLHLFIVDIRNPETLKTYPGITISDMGLKAGLNGVDNGVMIFDNYRIPRENMLNRFSEVTPDGTYVLKLEDFSEIFRMSMRAISGPRIHVINMAVSNLTKAITIAIRYVAVQKQVSPSDLEELPILEYQLTQFRLVPYLSASYILTIFCNNMLLNYQTRAANEDITAELHAIITVGKAVSGWLARDAVQECIEVCGGHGYIVAELTNLRNNHDASLTYDGENNVLTQQTSNWLIKCWRNILKGKKIDKTALNSIYFLTDFKNILNWNFFANDVEEALNPLHIIRTYKWLVCFLINNSFKKIQELTEKGLDSFTVRNNTQIYYLRTLSIVYFEHHLIEKVYEFINKVYDSSLKCILLKLLSLYGAWSLDKHFTILYQGGYVVGGKPAYLIKQGILNLCAEIKCDAVSLTDAIALHEFFITFPLGTGDEQVHKHLESAFLSVPNAYTRPDCIFNNKDSVIKNKL